MLNNITWIYEVKYKQTWQILRFLYRLEHKLLR